MRALCMAPRRGVSLGYCMRSEWVRSGRVAADLSVGMASMLDVVRAVDPRQTTASGARPTSEKAKVASSIGLGRAINAAGALGCSRQASVTETSRRLSGARSISSHLAALGTAAGSGRLMRFESWDSEGCDAMRRLPSAWTETDAAEPEGHSTASTAHLSTEPSPGKPSLSFSLAALNGLTRRDAHAAECSLRPRLRQLCTSHNMESPPHERPQVDK
jgi:hypothetical protein